ncbi:MAG TPA: DNA polymerase ligase N-terminal domain-containing protein [Micromonosporaceae bacterium]
MSGRLDEYRRKRDAKRTPEPIPDEPTPRGGNDTFVIQQHHARRLHWDLRLERDGVLVSWAVPRGIPRDPDTNHLAVHTEDHPLEYATFAGDIPAGEYGGGHVSIYDRGRYVTEKWRDDEVVVVFDGARVTGRYVLFHTSGKDWMIHRMDPPEPGWTPMPDRIEPMLASTADRLPTDDGSWGYELGWAGLRAIGYVSGGRLRLLDARGEDITSGYPELRAMAESLAPTECVLDGEVVALDADGHVSAKRLGRRTGEPDASATRRLATEVPVLYFATDLLWLDGRSTLDEPYQRRRALLTELGVAGPYWQTPPHFTGGGDFALDTSREQGLSEVVAKRLDSTYQPGRRSPDWLTIAPKNDPKSSPNSNRTNDRKKR